MPIKHIPTLLVLALWFLLIIPACKNASNGNAPKNIQPINVRIDTVRPERLVDAIQVIGVVKALEDASISPEEGGVVKEWKVKKGEHVKRGDIIVLLRDDILKASLEAAEAQYNMAELNLESQKKVFEEKGISEIQYRNLEFSRDAAKANADLMRARWNHMRITSPIDGIVDNTIPNVGEMAPPGVPIARVVNTAMIKVQAEVPEKYAAAISKGSPATITIDALPGDTLKGTLSFVGSSVSAANRALAVEIIVPNTFRKLKVDMTAKVTLIHEIRDRAFLVGEHLVQLVGRDRSILYIEKNGKAEERRVVLGGKQGNRVEVLDGLASGDHLIIAGFQKLVDGTPVIIAE